MIKTFKYKLKPTKAQAITFGWWLGTCRFVYNMCLGHKQDLYKNYGVNISCNDLKNELTFIRNEYNWVGEVHSQTLQDAVERMDKAYKSFFKGGGFPKFAKKEIYSSFAFKQKVGVCENTNKIKLPCIGKVSFHKSCEVPSQIKYAIVKKEYDGWYISLACDIEPEILPSSKNIIGIDLGIKDYLITDKGEKVDNPKFLAQYELELKECHQALSRKQKGSNNKKKAIFNLQKVYAKSRNKRKNFLHKLSTKIINENQVIIVEDLMVKNMSRRCKPKQDEQGKFLPNGQAAKSGLNKSILDAGWGMFVDMLEYKAAFHGRTFVKVPPHNTSKKCSYCQRLNPELTLNDRVWVCDGCGTEHDRDVNAAINIRERGLKLQKERLKEAGHVFSIAEII